MREAASCNTCRASGRFAQHAVAILRPSPSSVQNRSAIVRERQPASKRAAIGAGLRRYTLRMAASPAGLSPSVSPDRARLASALAQERLRLILGSLASRLLHVASIAALALLLVVAADHLLAGGLSRGLVRAAGVLWILGVAGAVIAYVAAAVVRRINPLFVARYIERIRGVPHNLLVNLFLVERNPRTDYVESAAARQALNEFMEPSGEPQPWRQRGATI